MDTIMTFLWHLWHMASCAGHLSLLWTPFHIKYIVSIVAGLLAPVAAFLECSSDFVVPMLRCIYCDWIRTFSQRSIILYGFMLSYTVHGKYLAGKILVNRAGKSYWWGKIWWMSNSQYICHICICEYWQGKFWRIAHGLPNPPIFSPTKIFLCTVCSCRNYLHT